MDGKIEITGLAALNRGLKAIDSDAPKQLRLALNTSATDFTEKLKRKVPVKSGAAQRSLVARSTRTSARIAVGGKKAPYYPWLDFGGQGRRQGRPAGRPFIKVGRYFYPTLEREKAAIADSLQAALDTVIRNAGLEAS